MRARAGFTLIEALLSLAILSLVLMVGQMIVTSTSVARDRLEGACEAASSAQSLEWLLRDDLRGIVNSAETARTFSCLPRGDADGWICSFVTVSNPLLRQTAGLFEVAYRLAPDAADPATFDLLRAQTPWPESPEAVWSPVFRKLSAIRLEYFNGADWLATWPADQEAFPSAVRVTLSIRPAAGEEQETYRTVIWIPGGGRPPKGTS